MNWVVSSTSACESKVFKMTEKTSLENCVLKEWVLGLSYKKQTVLMECIRGPDSYVTPDFKKIATFFRATILKNADPSTSFMKDAALPTYAGVEREFEKLPLHLAHHILLSLEVIAYDHPDSEIRRICLEFYQDSVRSQHLHTESKEEYERRMASKAYKPT